MARWVRATAAAVAEQQPAVEVLGVPRLLWGSGIPDCQVSLHELELVHLIEDAVSQADATIGYTHSPNDSHQDRHAVVLCTMGAARWVAASARTRFLVVGAGLTGLGAHGPSHNETR